MRSALNSLSEPWADMERKNRRGMPGIRRQREERNRNGEMRTRQKLANSSSPEAGSVHNFELGLWVCLI